MLSYFQTAGCESSNQKQEATLANIAKSGAGKGNKELSERGVYSLEA